MSRNRTPDQVAADVAPHVGSAILIECLFDSGTLRLTTHRGDLVIDGNTWYSLAAPLTVNPLPESADAVEGAEFQLSGLNPGIFDLVMAEPYQGRVLRMLELRFNADDQAVGAPAVEYVGRMKALTSSEDVSSHTHTVTVQTEQYDAEFERAQVIRFSDAEQRRRYPGDKGFEHVTALTEAVLKRQ